jgi:hypothetical protein
LSGIPPIFLLKYFDSRAQNPEKIREYKARNRNADTCNLYFAVYPHPQPGLCVYIIIHPINVCISVMNDIMLHIPHKTITTQDIQ